MWIPRLWTDIAALIGQAEETASLDFKRAISKNAREVAKDIAAMTVEGGVLVYGVEEDATTRRASAIVRFPLASQEERLQQIAGSNIRPTPAIEVIVLTEAPGDADGVIAVVVPRSSRAPHEVDGIFPRRDGTTTARMTEPEIDRLYQLRRHASGPLLSPTDLLAAVRDLPGIDGDPDYSNPMSGMGADTGILRVACRFDGDQRHPADPWLRHALDQAVGRADAWLDAHPLARDSALLERLDQDWQPYSVDGWRAGWAPTDAVSLWTSFTAAAAFLYPSHLLMQVTVPLTRDVAHDSSIDYRCAHEVAVAQELAVALRLAGEIFGAYEASGRFQVAVGLVGFGGAFSYSATRARPGMDTSRLAPASDGLFTTVESSPQSLLSEPTAIALELIGRWLASFHVGPDVFDNVRD